MLYLLLFIAIFSSAMLSIMSKIFSNVNEKSKNISPFYLMIVTFSALVSWGIVCIVSGEFTLRVIGFSLAYGVFYTLAMTGMFNAYKTGSTSLTAFIKQLSLIGVAFWGFVFWDTPLEVNVLVGIALIVLALYFCFKREKGEATPVVSFKWVMFSCMLLVGNMGSSIVQKYQQTTYGGSYGSAFMFFGVCMAFAVCLFSYLKGEKCSFKEINKPSLLCPVVAGASSMLLNLFTLKLISSPMPESIIFPGIAVGGMILTIMFSAIFYREKLTPVRWAGLCIGTVALIFLNL